MPFPMYLVRSPLSTLSDHLYKMGNPALLTVGIEKATHTQPGEVLQLDERFSLTAGQSLSYPELLRIVIEQKKVITL